MAEGGNDLVAAEIIIVRRKSKEEGGHGSTAWKIAFADFMTAMMALFLVLWLTNSTDQSTKKQIATYFNPLKLNEESAAPKGVVAETPQIPSEGEKEQMKPAEGESSGTRREAVGSFKNGPMPADEKLFRDPYDLIRRLTSEGKQDGAGVGDAAATGVDGGPAVKAGEAFRDPFDPMFRSEVLEASRQDALSEDKKDREIPNDVAGKADAGAAQKRDDSQKPVDVALATPASEDQNPVELGSPNTDGQAAADPKAVQANKTREEAGRMADEFKAALAGLDAAAVAKIEVSVDPAGILISLMDNDNFGMFSSASALPNPKLIELMAKMSGVLKKEAGKIVIRGHTDGRQFRSGTSDNWRLSMARAYSAYAILLDSGLEESRFGRIEGHADKSLRDTSDIGSASNRRIEILLERDPT